LPVFIETKVTRRARLLKPDCTSDGRPAGRLASVVVVAGERLRLDCESVCSCLSNSSYVFTPVKYSAARRVYTLVS